MSYNLSFQAPITTAASPKGFLIKGRAINATTTRNGQVFLAEELRNSASSLANKPLLRDHQNSVDAIVGKVKRAVYNATEAGIDFEATVFDKDIQKKIEDGLISSVSIGAQANEIIKEKNGNVVLKGIEFLELSLVAIPADPNASLAKAVYASFKENKKPAPKTPKKKTDSTLRVLELIKKLKQTRKKTHEEINRGPNQVTKNSPLHKR